MQKLNSFHLDFLVRWSRYITHIDLTAVLKNNSFMNIAIYGGGKIGELFYEYLYETDITVKYIIDRNVNLDFSYDVEILTPTQFIESGIVLDAVFITPLNYVDIIDYLKPFVNCPLIPLNHFIIDLDILQCISHIEEQLKNCNANLYLLDFSDPLVYIKIQAFESKSIYYIKRHIRIMIMGKTLKCYTVIMTIYLTVAMNI